MSHNLLKANQPIALVMILNLLLTDPKVLAKFTEKQRKRIRKIVNNSKKKYKDLIQTIAKKLKLAKQTNVPIFLASKFYTFFNGSGKVRFTDDTGAQSVKRPAPIARCS